MGQTNPDRLRHPPSPEEALTLAEIHLAGWTLKGSCSKCGVQLRANLPILIRAYGPDEIWWGKQPKCPVFDCVGRLVYSARAIPSGSWRSMRQAAPDRLIQAWKTKHQVLDRGPR